MGTMGSGYYPAKSWLARHVSPSEARVLGWADVGRSYHLDGARVIEPSAHAGAAQAAHRPVAIPDAHREQWKAREQRLARKRGQAPAAR